MPFSAEEQWSIEQHIAELWTQQDAILRSLRPNNIDVLIQINLEIDALEVQLSASLAE